MKTAMALIVGESDESVAALKEALETLQYTAVYCYYSTLELKTHDSNIVPEVLFVNVALLNDQVLSGYVKSLYPDIPVIVLCEHEELLLALEAIGGKADNYLIRNSKCMRKIAGAIRFASCRLQQPGLHAEYVKWFHTLIPRAILDVANIMFFVDYEDPDNQVNSQVKKAVARVFEDLDEEIDARLRNVV
ncbi:MAG: hypothetical protein JNL72_14125 [Flavipsychrobacter sp.]|nr:hypothetical protein [Flavipsychrobacter sp.]